MDKFCYDCFFNLLIYLYTFKNFQLDKIINKKFDFYKMKIQKVDSIER